MTDNEIIDKITEITGHKSNDHVREKIREILEEIRQDERDKEWDDQKARE